MKNLINKINEDINKAKKHKNSSTLGLTFSAALGIGGGIVCKNPKSFLYGISLTSNIISGIGHTITIIGSSVVIKKLKKILEKAIEQKKEIEEQINNLIKIASDLEKGLLPKYEKKFIINN